MLNFINKICLNCVPTWYDMLYIFKYAYDDIDFELSSFSYLQRCAVILASWRVWKSAFITTRWFVRYIVFIHCLYRYFKLALLLSVAVLLTQVVSLTAQMLLKLFLINVERMQFCIILAVDYFFWSSLIYLWRSRFSKPWIGLTFWIMLLSIG